MNIDGKEIGQDGKAYTIGEIGHNHGGSIATCLQMIRAAADAGADAVKLQRRHNRTLYTKAQYDAPYDNENSYGATYGEHREALELSLADWRTALSYAQDCGITLFGTAFDESSVDDLTHVGVPAIKIASGDLKNTPLIAYAAETGLPLIISTGGGSWDDCQRALEAAADTVGLALLHCTMAYPCAPEDLNLAVIPHMAAQMCAAGWSGVEVGASLHDSGISSAVVAYMLGARIIEKHFTLNRASKGTDHSFSLEPQGFKKMVRDLERARVSLGDPVKRPHPVESAAMSKMGKALFAARVIPAHTAIQPHHLKVCSPAPTGSIPPYLLDTLAGRITLEDLPCDHAIRDTDLAPLDVPADTAVSA